MFIENQKYILIDIAMDLLHYGCYDFNYFYNAYCKNIMSENEARKLFNKAKNGGVKNE